MATVAQIAAPEGTGRPQSDLRMTYLRWASQEPTKVATVAQNAAPQGTASYNVVCVGRTSAGFPRSPRKWRQLLRSQPPRGQGGLK